MARFRHLRHRVGLVCGAALWLAGAGLVWAEELRTWSDATGKHKMEAEYAGMSGTKVKLTLKTGKKMEIEIKQLSKADQKYIESLDADNPFQAAEDPEAESPFQAKESEGEEMEKPESSEEESPGKSVSGEVNVDWNQSEALLLDSEADEWKATVAPHPGWDSKPKTIVLPPRSDFFEATTGMAVNHVAQKAVVCFRLGREDKDSQVRLMICDLKTGKAGSIATEQALMTPIALHDDGQQVLMRHDAFGHGHNETLELWKIKGKTVQKMLSWFPYEEKKDDVNWAEFVDADHLLTCSVGGRIAYWDLKTAQPIWHFETANGAGACLSGDRKTLGFCTGERVGLFDIAERKVIAMSETPGALTWPITAFSPSGKRMACIAQSRVIVWDTTNGKVLYDFETPGLDLHWGIGFPDDNFLIGSHKYVIELENQLKLWEYSGADQVRTVGNLTFAALGVHNAPGALLSLELPHKEARALLAKALTQPDLFVFRQGTAVKLDVSGVPVADQDHVREALTKKLTAMKCPVDEGGTISLVATVSGPKEREISYMRSGDYKVQEYITQLQFMYQGQPAWSASGTNIPGFLMLKRGENIEGVLRKASEKPNISFYDGVIFPKFLQKPTAGQGANGQQTIGSSKLTTSGLK